jgi:hypothetical protein
MSTLKVTNLADTSGGNSRTTAQIFNGTAKAWGAFNNVGGISVRATFNVNSITDGGDCFFINFSTPMSDANYSIVTSQSYRIDAGYVQGMQCPIRAYSSTQFGMQPFSGNTVYMNTQFMQFAVFR